MQVKRALEIDLYAADEFSFRCLGAQLVLGVKKPSEVDTEIGSVYRVASYLIHKNLQVYSPKQFFRV